MVIVRLLIKGKRMIIMIDKKTLTNKKGLTLVEILAAIVIISIIFISIIIILNLTAKSNRTSHEIIDATYIAQREMEFIYKLSSENVKLESYEDYVVNRVDGEWTVYRKKTVTEDDDYFIEVKEDKTDNPMTRIIVQVFDKSDTGMIDPKAQMETLLKWGEDHVENSP